MCGTYAVLFTVLNVFANVLLIINGDINLVVW